LVSLQTALPRYRPNGETGRRMGLKIPRGSTPIIPLRYQDQEKPQ
jgi:hypothetical protein